MTTILLYSGNGKSYSTKFEDGMRQADKTRCIADDGKILQLEDVTFYCRDVLNEKVSEIVEKEDNTQVVEE